ncbi:MAG TPA: hypothetical protein V6D27_01180 [Vampirovibrionales bacterium]
MSDCTVAELKSLYPSFNQARHAFRFTTAKSWSALIEWINGREKPIQPDEIYRWMPVNNTTNTILRHLKKTTPNWEHLYKVAIAAERSEDTIKSITFQEGGEIYRWAMTPEEARGLVWYADHRVWKESL